MHLNDPQKSIYASEQCTALEAQRLAQEIAFAPIVFQVSRLMIKFGIFKMLSDSNTGLSQKQIQENTGLSRYAAQVLLESSLTIGTIHLKDELFTISKAGWFLLNDRMARVNMDFNHDINYQGLFFLEEALLSGKPSGLKTLGNWPTVYEGLSSLTEQQQKSWFGFDHFYSDNSFSEALNIVFANKPHTLLDVGGNTGRWATQCVQHDSEVEVTIMDLPQQIELMQKAVAKLQGSNRIHGHGVNLLNPSIPFPMGFDAIWMSQFLDCFSEMEVVSILSRAAQSMMPNSKLYIMETLWDRQRFETASYCLAQTSVYFTTIANGNSKMFYSEDLIRCIETAGLQVEALHDNLGLGHSILQCILK